MIVDITLKKKLKNKDSEHILSKELDSLNGNPAEIFVRIIEQFREYSILDADIEHLKSIDFLYLKMMPVRDADFPPGMPAPPVPTEYFHIDVMDQMVDYIEKNIYITL